MEKDNNQCCGNNLPVWKILGTIMTIWLVVFISVLIWNEIKKHDYIGRESQQTYTITIDGQGKITATPDIAQISLGLQTQMVKVADAQKENTDKMNKIIAELKAMGIESKDIQTANYSIYPNYEYPNGKQVLKNYIVSQNINVKIRNLEKIGDVVQKAGTLGANQIGGLSFTIDEPEKIKQLAREKALLAAKEKAESLAKIAGVKLGKLVSFTESAYGGPIPNVREYALKVDANAAAAALAPTVEAGSQDIIVDVMVTYEVL
jgi:hypothetical protein